MALIRSKRENITILDFSSGKLSKNKIKQCLRNIKISEIYNKDTKTLTVFDNHIKVGMYNIKLMFYNSENCNGMSKKLRECGKFQVDIYESNLKINLNKDKKFQNQYWINQNDNLGITNLIDIIYHCYRLNRLKIFL